MFRITLPADRAEPDMAAVAKAFGIGIRELEGDIHIGVISRWFEVGEGDEDNKPHQIFASAKLGLRVDVDEHGNVHSSNKYQAMGVVSQPHRAENSSGCGSKDFAEEASDSDIQDNSDSARRARLDALLDEALDESFPASDPIAISFESRHRTASS